MPKYVLYSNKFAQCLHYFSFQVRIIMTAASAIQSVQLEIGRDGDVTTRPIRKGESPMIYSLFLRREHPSERARGWVHIQSIAARGAAGPASFPPSFLPPPIELPLSQSNISISVFRPTLPPSQSGLAGGGFFRTCEASASSTPEGSALSRFDRRSHEKNATEPLRAPRIINRTVRRVRHSIE